MKSLKSLDAKINQPLQIKKKIEVHLVLPDCLLTSFFAFLNRPRKFSPLNFYLTHSGARQTVLEIAKQYPEITVNVFVSQITCTRLGLEISFSQLDYEDRSELINYLDSQQQTPEEIKDSILYYEI